MQGQLGGVERAFSVDIDRRQGWFDWLVCFYTFGYPISMECVNRETEVALTQRECVVFRRYTSICDHIIHLPFRRQLQCFLEKADLVIPVRGIASHGSGTTVQFFLELLAGFFIDVTNDNIGTVVSE